MNTTARLIRCYGWLLHLYPSSFQRIFGEEAQMVFAESLRDAESCGQQAVWFCFLREVLDLPFNFLREYVSGKRFNELMERWLTHKKRTRWQQAGSLAFLMSFGLLELLHGLPQVLTSGRAYFVSWWGWFNAVPGNTARIQNGFEPENFIWLSICGLVTGAVFSYAQKTVSPLRRGINSLGCALGLCLPYLTYYLTRYEFILLQQGPLQPWQIVGNILKIVFLVILIGGLPAVIIGIVFGVRRLKKILNLLITGTGGLVLGLVGGLLIALIVTVPFSLLLFAIHPDQSFFNAAWGWGVTWIFFVTILSSGMTGWIYGGRVGLDISEFRAEQAAPHL